MRILSSVEAMTDNAGEDAKRCRTVAVIGAGASGLTKEMTVISPC